MAGVLTAFGLRRGPTFQERVVGFLVRWAVLSLAVWVAAELVDGIHYEGWRSIVAVALVLGLLNALVRPILFVLSLPLTVLTLGLFIFVLNAFMLWLADRIASRIGDIAFSIDHFWWDAVLGALVISVVSWLVGMVAPKRRW